MEDKKINSRIPADFAIQPHLKMGLFPSTGRVYRFLITVPPSVCKIERSFSELKILKTPLRGKMQKERLDDLMVLSYEKNVTDKTNLQTVVQAWENV